MSGQLGGTISAPLKRY